MRRLNRTKRVVQLSLVFFSLVLNQLPAGGQTHRAGVQSGKLQPPAESTSIKPSADGKPTKLLSSAKNEKMAVPFNTGKLPEPLRKPSGSIDEMAVVLAKQVRARDEQAVPALLTAILTAGFGLRDIDGSVLQTVDPGQGLVFDAWEVAAVAKMYGESRSTPLTYLTDGLKSIPELKSMPLEKILLEGIRKHAQGEQPLLRFWARFIVELGRQQDEPYDILKGTAPKSIRLDAVQSAFLLRRLIGDFYGFAERSKQASVNFGADDSLDARRAWMEEKWRPLLFIRAGWNGYDPPQFLRKSSKWAVRSLRGGPCGSLGEGDNATILDAGATVITTGWGEMLDKLAPPDSFAEKYGKFLNVANILLAYAKFIATYAALETEITVENPPLVRTKNSTPGERRQLTATVKMNTGGWDSINCFRTALNVATGLDFSLIKDGPLEGVEVNWDLDEDGDFYSNSAGITGKRQSVNFAGNNTPRIQDAGTYAGIPGKGGTPVGNLTRTKTDKEGKARIFLEGSPKIPYVAEPLITVMKQAAVHTTIKMKGGDIKGDATDVMGQVLSGVSGLVTMPLELLYRTDWASSGYLIVPVSDHERCKGEWYGTITYTQTFKDDRSFQEENQRGNWSREESYEATVEFTSERLNPEQRVAAYTAKVKTKASYSETRYGRGTSKALCNLENNMTINGSGNYEGTENVGVMLTTDGRYTVSYHLPSVNIKAQMTKSRKILECKNPFIKPSSSSGTVDRNVSAGAPDIEGMIDPKNPNVLKGSKTVTFPKRNGTKTGTLTWNLVRCGK